MNFWDTLNASGDAITAIGTLGTFAIACFVYLEARRIRKTEWILNQNAAWNAMSTAVAEQSSKCRIGDILSGDPHDGNLSTQEEYLLMMFLNVVNSEYNALRAGAISPRWVLHSFEMTSGIVSQNREWLVGFMQQYGYQPSFIRVVAILPSFQSDFKARTRMVKREILASSQLGRIMGPTFRHWLRKDYLDDVIRPLCD